MCHSRIIKGIAKTISIFLILLMCFETFSTSVSNNDGSAFITKAEFDALKNSFQSQIDNYNTSIDSKIDGAIAAYLSGINVATEKDIPVGSYVDKIYCMKSASNTEAKDMKYVYVKPYVNYEYVGWCRAPSTGGGGIYAWDYIFTPKAKQSTGKRLLIRNTADPSGGFGGSAEWVGYAESVSESQVWLADDVIFSTGWGYHTGTNKMGLGMNHADPIKNIKLNDRNWKIGLAYQDMYGHDGRPNKSALVDLADKFNIYLLSLDSSYGTIKNQNMIIWGPETYYCFTENDVLRDYMFDAKQSISGWTTSNTSAEKVYLDCAGAASDTQTGLNDFTDLFSGCSRAMSRYWQSNIGDAKRNPVGTVYIESRVAYKMYDYGTSTASGSAKLRQPYTVQGFPWYSINNWKQLYITLNDWAAKTDIATTNTSIITTPTGDKHLSLNAGWPIVNVNKGNEYEYEISFDDATDHLVWGKLEPFTTSNANTESNTIKWDSSITTASGFTNAALVSSGSSLKLKFKAEKDGLFYLKWAIKPTSGIVCSGGGTLKPSKTIHEKAKKE